MYLVDMLLSNALAATMIAFVAHAVGKIPARPQTAHVLWVLVLLKMVTPPLFLIPLGTSVGGHFDAAQEERRCAPSVTNHAKLLQWSGKEPATDSPMVRHFVECDSAESSGVAESFPPIGWHSVKWVLLGIWCGGSLLWFTVAWNRLAKFRRMIRLAGNAPSEITDEAGRIAKLFGLRNSPRIVVVRSRIPPLLFGIGKRCCIALPLTLLSGLDDLQRRCILAHELAHVRRGDQWIRWLEFAAVGIFWWYPVVWWARSELQRVEELCCDNWVLRILPGHDHSYAECLLNTVDFLSGTKTEALSFSATGFNSGGALMKRIENVMNNDGCHSLSRSSKWSLAFLFLFFLPLGVASSPKTLPLEDQAGADRVPTVTIVDTAKLDLHCISILPKQRHWNVDDDIKDLCLTNVSNDGRKSVSELAEELARSIQAHPYVREVLSIEVDTSEIPPKITVTVRYKKPAVMVRGKGGYWPVASDGVLLPPNWYRPSDVRKYLRVHIGELKPTGPPGSRFGNTGVIEAARIATLLRNTWRRAKLEAISIADTDSSTPHTYVLEATARGIRVIWGHAPGSEAKDEAMASEKVKRLTDFAMKNQNVLPSPGTVLDVRPARAAILTAGHE